MIISQGKRGTLWVWWSFPKLNWIENPLFSQITIYIDQGHHSHKLREKGVVHSLSSCYPGGIWLKYTQGSYWHWKKEKPGKTENFPVRIFSVFTRKLGKSQRVFGRSGKIRSKIIKKRHEGLGLHKLLVWSVCKPAIYKDLDDLQKLLAYT